MHMTNQQDIFHVQNTDQTLVKLHSCQSFIETKAKKC